TTVTLNDPQFITVSFPGVPIVPAGLTIDPASITDLDAEFTLDTTGLQNLAKSGPGDIHLVAGEAPTKVGTGNTYRYHVTGNFAADGTQSVTVNFTPHGWSFTTTDAIGLPQPTLASFGNHTWLDIALATSVDTTPATTPVTLTDVLAPSEITLTATG